MAQTIALRELRPYRELFYEGISRKESHGCDTLFRECSMRFGSCSVDDFIRQAYMYLSVKKNNLAMVSAQASGNPNYSRNLANIEIILSNFERRFPEYR